MAHSDDAAPDSKQPGAAVKWVKRQCRGFFDDPLGYAIDKWIYLILLGLGISILASACKGLLKEIRNLF